MKGLQFMCVLFCLAGLGQFQAPKCTPNPDVNTHFELKNDLRKLKWQKGEGTLSDVEKAVEANKDMVEVDVTLEDEKAPEGGTIDAAEKILFVGEFTLEEYLDQYVKNTGKTGVQLNFNDQKALNKYFEISQSTSPKIQPKIVINAFPIWIKVNVVKGPDAKDPKPLDLTDAPDALKCYTVLLGWTGSNSEKLEKTHFDQMKAKVDPLALDRVVYSVDSSLKKETWNDFETTLLPNTKNYKVKVQSDDTEGDILTNLKQLWRQQKETVFFDISSEVEQKVSACGQPIKGFFEGTTLAGLTWTKSVTSKKDLDTEIEGSVNMITADVYDYEIKKKIEAVVGLPPTEAGQEAYKLSTFLADVNPLKTGEKKKGIKLDFKTAKAFEVATKNTGVMSSLESDWEVPVMININLVKTEGGEENEIVAATSMEILSCHHLSVGWSTGDDEVKYTDAKITEIKTKSDAVNENPKTFAVRVDMLTSSWDSLEKLLLKPNEKNTLRVFSVAENHDKIAQAATKDIIESNEAKLYLDVSDSTRQFLYGSGNSVFPLSFAIVVLLAAIPMWLN